MNLCYAKTLSAFYLLEVKSNITPSVSFFKITPCKKLFFVQDNHSCRITIIYQYAPDCKRFNTSKGD